MRPRVATDFKRIYKPSRDQFPGPDSEHLRAGQWYDDWIANDHCFITDANGLWHAFGIINAVCPALHEGAWMAFHITEDLGLRQAERVFERRRVCPQFSEVPRAVTPLEERTWTEHPKVLTPAERPGERKDLYAPFVVERDGLYYMFYGPHEMRLATSRHLFHWEPQGTLFEQYGAPRDPHVWLIDGVYHMVYVAGESVFLRTSHDLRSWFEPPLEIYHMTRPGAPESPLLIQHDGGFYLFWCIYDGENGYYDNRTFVFRADTPYDFNNAEPLPMLRAHCPEVFQDAAGAWYISSGEWPYRGVSLARLEWEEGKEVK